MAIKVSYHFWFLICDFCIFSLSISSKLRWILQMDSAWQSISEPAFLITFQKHQTGFLRRWSRAFQPYIVNLQTHLWLTMINFLLLFHIHYQLMFFLHKLKLICGAQSIGNFHPSTHILITLLALGNLRNSVDLTAQWWRFNGFVEIVRSYRILNISCIIIGEPSLPIPYTFDVVMSI